MLNKSCISLLYPDEIYFNEKYKLSNFSFIEDLNLYSLFSINPDKLNLESYFTKSYEVIIYRQKIYSDLEKCDVKEIEQVITMMDDINDLRTFRKEASDILSILYVVSEINVYISMIQHLSELLTKYEFSSDGLLKLRHAVIQIKDSRNFKELCINSLSIQNTLKTMNSMTIGVNLDQNLRPVEAGVVSLNETPFRSGNIIDRVLSADIRNDGYRCLTPLTPVKNEFSSDMSRALEIAFNNAIEDLIKKSLKSWKPLIKNYISDHTSELLCTLSDLSFYLAFIRYYSECKSKNLVTVLPEISDTDQDIFYERIYNVNLSRYSGHIVYNDNVFDKNGMIYILTGSNQGGKSIFLKALGINQALFQLGFYVHAKKAGLRISNNILTYFTKNNEDSIGYGHLGEECNTVSNLLRHASKDTLVLMDEPFSSTSVKDGIYIFKEVIAALADIGVYGVVITHIHEMYDEMKHMKNVDNGKIDSLIALMANTENGIRSYVIVRDIPRGESYASDIAKKYGIQRENIVKNIS